MSTTKRVKNFTVALGEVSGHHHTVYTTGEVEVLEDAEYKTWKPTATSQMTHQEHDIQVYEKNRLVDTSIQQEYDPFAKVIRQVRD